MGVVASNLLFQQAIRGRGFRTTSLTDEMSCDSSYESSPSPQPLLYRHREQKVKSIVHDIRGYDGNFCNSSCSTPNSSVKRRVRFQTPMPDRHELSDVIDPGILGASDKVDVYSDCLYWTRKELLACRKRALLKASVIRTKFPLEVESLEHVIQNCRVATINLDGKRCHENKSNGMLLDNAASCLQFLNSETEDVLAVYNWSCSYVRGLEDYITPILSAERHHFIHQFLSYQEFLHHRKVLGTNIEAALCERSRNLSQRARDFAFKMAIGDALAATHHQ
jgi:hypothetical protein